MKTSKWIIYIAFILLSSCEEVIEWKVSEKEAKLVVDGSVSNELRHHTVRLSRTTGYYNEEGPKGVSGAEVKVVVDQEVYLYIESSNENGLYVSSEPFSGVPGKVYNLYVNLPEQIGESDSYEASTTMPPLQLLDSIIIKKENDLLNEEIHSLLIFGYEPKQSTDFYLMKVYRNGELLTKEVDEFILLDDELIQGFEFKEFALYSSTEIVKGDTINLEVYGIERLYHQYVTNLAGSRSSGDPFGLSGPPSNVFGNVSNGALGYFFAGEKAVYKAVAED